MPIWMDSRLAGLAAWLCLACAQECPEQAEVHPRSEALLQQLSLRSRANVSDMLSLDEGPPTDSSSFPAPVLQDHLLRALRGVLLSANASGTLEWQRLTVLQLTRTVPTASLLVLVPFAACVVAMCLYSGSQRFASAKCPKCSQPMVLSTFAEGAYASGWRCQVCGMTARTQPRWWCQSCSCDVCVVCKNKHEGADTTVLATDLASVGLPPDPPLPESPQATDCFTCCVGPKKPAG